LFGGEFSSAATVLLEGCVFGGLGASAAVGGLAAGWGAEALCAASGGGGDVRHQDLATTALYAKVDLNTLRQVAQPWPGAIR